MAKQAGFDISKADWLRFQARDTLELNDEGLEAVAGGKMSDSPQKKTHICCHCTPNSV
jgi:hypothetical protein